MPLIQTDLDNAMRDAQDLGKFVNDAAGTVATRIGGTIPNLKSLIATIQSYVTGTEILQTGAGNVTVTTQRKVLIKKTSAQTTTVTLPAASTRAGVPITVANLGNNDYVANPTTVQLSAGALDTGETSYLMDAGGQVATFWPMPDNSGYYVA
jgi:hypothetical protein